MNQYTPIYKLLMATPFIVMALIYATKFKPIEETMDPQSQAFLEQFNALNLPPMETQTPDQVRKDVEAQAAKSDVALSHIYNITIPGPQGEIPLRIYIPKESSTPLPVFVTFHGGGWVFGSLNVHDPFCREIALLADRIVVSVDYRLAPEHPFPEPLIDCYAAVDWVAKNIQKYGGDPSQLAIGGDSAGGNLSAAVTLMAKDKGGPSITYQVLIYPVLQHRFDTSSYERYAENYFLTRDSMKWFWSLYLGDEKNGDNPYISPLLAKDLSGLPPTLIVSAQFDPLYDEAVLYAERLKQAGVPVVMKTYPTIHVFVSFANYLKIGQQAIQDIASALRSGDDRR